MVQSRTDSRRETDRDDEPLVPVGVLEGVDNIAEGKTASKEDIEAVLKF